jgi:hypothetical protein
MPTFMEKLKVTRYLISTSIFKTILFHGIFRWNLGIQ